MKKYLPLELLKEYRTYPKLWEAFTSVELKDGLEIDSPKKFLDRYKKIAGIDACLHLIHTDEYLDVAALSAWRIHKQIYQFEPEFWKDLTETKFDGTIPAEILKQVPYPAFWIDPLEAIVYFAHDHKDNLVMTVQCFGDSDETSAVIVRDGITLDQGLDEMARITMEQLRDRGKFNFIERPPMELMSDALQATLYLCSQNADIQESSQSRKNYRPRPGQIRDVQAEVRQWDVGKVYVKSLRQARRSEADPGREVEIHHSSGWTVRPHVRKAHWHHYRCGKGRKDLVLKWTAPMYVGLGDEKEPGATVTLVGKPKKKQG